MKMISYISVLGILAFLVADVRTGPSQEKDIEPLRCYSCGLVGNMTDCDHNDDQPQVSCPPKLPYCATTAKSPDYISSLTCTVGNSSPCTLIQTAKDTYEMTCMCDGHLCNKPFTREFQNELLNFSSTNLPDNTTTGLLEMFMNSSVFGNITAAKFYEAITMTVTQTTKLTPVSPSPMSSSTVKSKDSNVNAPRAEALKHEATVPSDDDEDEGEGSGSFEDAKQQAPAAPAAPSSFLPANENTANKLHINILATISFISLYTLA